MSAGGFAELGRLMRETVAAASEASWAEGRYVYGAPGKTSRELQREWHDKRDAADAASRAMWEAFHSLAGDLRDGDTPAPAPERGPLSRRPL